MPHSSSPLRPSPILALLALLLAVLTACTSSGDDDDGTGHVDADGDGVAADAGDCDDNNSAIHAGAPESCDGLDNDCDSQVDDGYDFDLDGYFTNVDLGCAAHYLETDCNDGDASIHPGAEEQCNDKDDDCDHEVDDGLDLDHDGVLSCDGDCDDENSAIHPGAADVCDGLDNDCNTISDEFDDEDGDGVGDCLDCDDGDFLVGPNAEEVCDGVDNNCDEVIDEGFDGDGDGSAFCTDCDDEDPTLFPGNAEQCDFLDNDCDTLIDEGFDLDGDTYFSCHDPLDCDDTNDEAFPGNTETCDGADNDCDGSIDEGLAADRDGDGYTNCSGDCLDTNGSIHPGATEVCDGLDDDCTSGTPGTERDYDGDGYVSCTPVDRCDIGLISDGSSVVWNTLASTLLTEGYAYQGWFNNATELETENVSTFDGYGLLVWSMSERDLTTTEASQLEAFVQGGGRLLVTGPGILDSANPSLLAALVRSSATGPGPDDGLCTVEDGSHPIANGSSPVAEGTTFTLSDTLHDNAAADGSAGAVEVVSVGGVAKIIAVDVGAGRVVYWNGNYDVDDWDSGPAAAKDLFTNTLEWLADGCLGVQGPDCNDSDPSVHPGSGC